jgi:hypothetical protein
MHYIKDVARQLDSDLVLSVLQTGRVREEINISHDLWE